MEKEIAPGIGINPAVKFGKPVLQGTGVPVDLVVGKLAAGMTTEEVMEEYEITREQVLNAMRYAASRVSEEELACV